MSASFTAKLQAVAKEITEAMASGRGDGGSANNGAANSSSGATTILRSATTAPAPASASAQGQRAAQVDAIFRASKKAPAQATKNVRGMDDAFSGTDLPAPKKQKKDSSTMPMTSKSAKASREPAAAMKVKRTEFCESLGSDMIQVKIGKAGIVIPIHKDRLCKVSAFFDKAFNGPFKEANEKEMVIDDVEVAVFDTFVEWLYNTPITLSDKITEALNHLVDVYILADRFMSTGLKDHIMDKIQDRMQCGCCSHASLLPIESARKIFENTLSSTDAPIRKYCAALVCRWMVTGRDCNEIEDYFKIKDFLQELSDYQKSAVKSTYDLLESRRERHALDDDPRIRGYHLIFPFDDEMEVGHTICFFHSHGSKEKCKSVTNYSYESEYGIY